MEERSITGVSVLENIMMVTIHPLKNVSENTAKIFSKLAKEEINVDMISQSPLPDGSVSVSFTASAEEEPVVRTLLTQLLSSMEGVELSIRTDDLKLSVVGSGMRTQSGVAARLFELFSENAITFLQVTTSEISISYTLEKKYKDQAVQLIADAFHL